MPANQPSPPWRGQPRLTTTSTAITGRSRTQRGYLNDLLPDKCLGRNTMRSIHNAITRLLILAGFLILTAEGPVVPPGCEYPDCGTCVWCWPNWYCAPPCQPSS